MKVGTEPANVVTILGEGWYEKYTHVYLVTPDSVVVSQNARYEFSHWDVGGISQGKGVNSTVVLMFANLTATAHYTQIVT